MVEGFGKVYKQCFPDSTEMVISVKGNADKIIECLTNICGKTRSGYNIAIILSWIALSKFMAMLLTMSGYELYSDDLHSVENSTNSCQRDSTLPLTLSAVHSHCIPLAWLWNSVNNAGIHTNNAGNPDHKLDPSLPHKQYTPSAEQNITQFLYQEQYHHVNTETYAGPPRGSSRGRGTSRGRGRGWV